MPPVASPPPSGWVVLPNLLWFFLVFALLIFLRKELRQILSEIALRLRSGAAIKVASVELGSMVVVPGFDVSQHEKEIGVRSDAHQMREQERLEYRTKNRDIMLVHRLDRSREDGDASARVVDDLHRASQGGVANWSVKSRIFSWVVLGQQNLSIE